MGGVGSGRLFGNAKAVVEEQISIKMSDLKKYEIEAVIRLDWKLKGRDYTAGVYYRVEELLILLEHGDDSYPQRIELKTFNCHLGGSRRWLICPICFSQRTALYLGNKMNFACRKCNNIGYKSQKKVPADRLLHNAEKLRSKIGQTPIFNELSPKPKWQHNRTYEVLRNRIYDYETQSHDQFIGWFRGLVNRANV